MALRFMKYLRNATKFFRDSHYCDLLLEKSI